MSTEKSNADLLEQLSKEKHDLMQSPAWKIGNRILDFKKKLTSGNFAAISKDLKDKRAAGIIRRRYLNHLDRPEQDVDERDIETPKIAVYTCILGGYDHAVQHLPDFDNADYILLTDDPARYEDLKDRFIIQKLPDEILEKGNILGNRYVKMHPHELFEDDYDYAIYMDGNVRVMADIRKMIRRVPEGTGIAMHNHRERDDIYSEAESCKLLRRGDPEKIDRQMSRYRSAGFPAHFGMNECTVIVTDMKNSNAKTLMNLWWEEFTKSESFRDQLAWPFMLWENGYLIEDIGNLGNDIYRNPIVEIERHA